MAAVPASSVILKVLLGFLDFQSAVVTQEGRALRLALWEKTPGVVFGGPMFSVVAGR